MIRHRSVALLALCLGASLACDPAPQRDTNVAVETAAPRTAEPPLATDPPSAAPVSSSAAPVAPPPSGNADSPTKAQAAQIAKAVNALGLDVYAKGNPKSGNFVISPASISFALTMTWGGAKGETAEQMKKALHFDGSSSEIVPLAGKVASALADPNRAGTLRIANKLFGDKRFKFEQAFLDSTKSSFGAVLEPVDFRKDAEGARRTINGWVEKQTEKRIVDLIPKGGVDKETRLSLVNAMYFLGDWSQPFEKDATRDEDFRLTNANKKQVPTMHASARYRFAEKDGVKALEISYRGSKSAMVFLLPNAVDGLPALEKALPGKLDGILGALADKMVDVSLPKFEVNPKDSLPLAEVLKGLGMVAAFDPKKADFTGLANPPSPDDRLYIGNVFHKAFVKVDEKGTEAAAATAVNMPRVTSARIPVPAEAFKADHPFLFALRDAESGLILFMGRVVDPS